MHYSTGSKNLSVTVQPFQEKISFGRDDMRGSYTDYNLSFTGIDIRLNIFRKNVKSRSFFPACAFVELQCNFIVIIYEEMALLDVPGCRFLSDSLAGWQINRKGWFRQYAVPSYLHKQN